MTVDEVMAGTFVFDAGEKRIVDCERQELLEIIAHQQTTLEMQQNTVHRTFALLGRGSNAPERRH